jgi:hypothetical protein
MGDGNGGGEGLRVMWVFVEKYSNGYL